jgi:hypothetical protein
MLSLNTLQRNSPCVYNLVIKYSPLEIFYPYCRFIGSRAEKNLFSGLDILYNCVLICIFGPFCMYVMSLNNVAFVEMRVTELKAFN